jgi:hypothetical protein
MEAADVRQTYGDLDGIKVTSSPNWNIEGLSSIV